MSTFAIATIETAALGAPFESQPNGKVLLHMRGLVEDTTALKNVVLTDVQCVWDPVNDTQSALLTNMTTAVINAASVQGFTVPRTSVTFLVGRLAGQ